MAFGTYDSVSWVRRQMRELSVQDRAPVEATAQLQGRTVTEQPASADKIEACLRHELSAEPVGLPAEITQIIAGYAETLTPIKEWQDAIPFTGRIVAYQVERYLMEGGYSLEPIPGLLFAYINRYGVSYNKERGHYINGVVKKGTRSGIGYRLTDDFLERANMKMRLATEKELQRIRQAIDSDLAEFTETTKGDSCNMLAGLRERFLTLTIAL